MGIGGNVTCQLMKNVSVANAIGEQVRILEPFMNLRGYLDLRGETTDRERFKGKLEQTTNVFVMDFVEIDVDIRSVTFVDHKGRKYDVLLIDNPMELNRQIEIYLERVQHG